MPHHVVSAKPKRSRFKFFGETIAELKKVVWLTRREAMYLTFLVLIVAVVSSLILGGVDLGFTRLIDTLFLGK
ncbi:MAG TPA: preprotein translocase subunit SecE [Dehalococcoidia bacterium]|jgi:preprotein translocase subunit SecE|nr:preprotein translocase subunit SecE [Dehalococcoidia bacterium]